MEKKFNYIYKLTLVSDPRYFYYGKRSTNLEDDSKYLGSGRGLLKYKKLYGKEAFTKEILSYWPTSKSALDEEARIVTPELLLNPFCLNRRKGGQGTGREDPTGKIWIHYNSEMRMIPAESWKDYEKWGWQKGMSQECKEHLSESQKGIRAGIRLSEEHRKKLSLSKQGKPNLKARGLRRTDEQRGHMSKPRSEVGRKHIAEANTGKVWISDGNVCKRVLKSEIEFWEQKGWVRGRKAWKVSESISQKGTVFITNGVETKRVNPETLDEWKNRGWTKGRIGKNQHGVYIKQYT